MKIKAISYEQKKAQSFHIVNGMVCKNCKRYNDVKRFCSVHGILNKSAYDYCSDFSDFKRRRR